MSAMARRLLSLVDPYHPRGLGLADRGPRLYFCQELVFEGAFRDSRSLDAALKMKQLPEVAFLGRSNVGKSSLINAIVDRKVAVTSATPGRTRSLNVLRVGTGCRLVDVPGYGFGSKQEYMTMLGNYVKKRRQLQVVYQLIDSATGIKDIDRAATDLILQSRVPIRMVLTKADQLNEAALRLRMIEVEDYILKIQKELADTAFIEGREGAEQGHDRCIVLAVSAKQKQGLCALCTALAMDLGLEAAAQKIGKKT